MAPLWTEATLRVLAAFAAAWVYNEPDPQQFPLPYFLDIGDKRIELSYKQRMVVGPDERDPTRKATFVATMRCGEEQVRVFVLTFRGTVGARDWMNNLSAGLNRAAFQALGLDVHAGWSTAVHHDALFTQLKVALKEELRAEGGLDFFLMAGHSLGGALAQVAALFAYQESLRTDVDVDLRPLVGERLRCVTLAAPQPFSPTPKPSQATTLALDWMKRHCLNFVNNNDIVPRLPGNMGFIEKFTQRMPRIAVGAYRVGAVQLDVPAMLASASQNSHLSQYRPIVATRFVGHSLAEEGDLLEPEDAKERLKQESAPDPATAGPKNWFSGGILGAGADHAVQKYVNQVYRAHDARDHVFGHSREYGYEAPTKYKNGGCYEGQVRNGKRHGAGTLTWANGDRYEGQFQDDKLQGAGIFTSANGDRYEGQFQDFEFNGAGVMTFANGDRYEGQFQDDSLRGAGVFTFANGNRYKGQFQNDNFHGDGNHTWANGGRYEGQWKDGKRHGAGASTFANGDRYEGQCQNGKRHGAGAYTWASGDRYEGQWKDGKRHGAGVFTSANNGEHYEQQWKDGKLAASRGRGAGWILVAIVKLVSILGAVMGCLLLLSETADLALFNVLLALRLSFEQVCLVASLLAAHGVSAWRLSASALSEVLEKTRGGDSSQDRFADCYAMLTLLSLSSPATCSSICPNGCRRPVSAVARGFGVRCPTCNLSGGKRHSPCSDSRAQASGVDGGPATGADSAPEKIKALAGECKSAGLEHRDASISNLSAVVAN